MLSRFSVCFDLDPELVVLLVVVFLAKLGDLVTLGEYASLNNATSLNVDTSLELDTSPIVEA